MVPIFLIGSTSTLLLGTATKDTIDAGEGPVFEKYLTSLRRPRTVYGQIVRLERAAGAGTARIGDMMSGGDLHAVLVPWNYSAGCTPVVWQGTAQWTTPDSTAVYLAQLRPDSLWASGMPTFDVLFAEATTFAYSPARLFAPRKAEPTPEQVFDRNAQRRQP